MTDTIFALSSGAPPAAIGVIRISGPEAGKALSSLTKRDFEPRVASVSTLRAENGGILDEALVLWFEGPNTATGEDLAELHCHGGRAVLLAVEQALSRIEGLRPAEPGEFTRRAFANGRIDLAEAEGLADLLNAETELQRSAAMMMAGGQFSSQVEHWREDLLQLSGQLEAALDFSDEDDVSGMPDDFSDRVTELHSDLVSWLERPRAERLGEGFKVVLAGPPNVGKSTLFNMLVESEAAITSPIEGTTRDAIERSVAIDGVPFTFVDTAGLRDVESDEIERIGVQRAQEQLVKADLVLWLGPEGEGPAGAWEIDSRIDEAGHTPKASPQHSISAVTGENVGQLMRSFVSAARLAMPKPGEAVLNARQHALLSEAAEALDEASTITDPLLIAECLRRVRIAFDRLVGRATTEDMLDALFGRFCIGK